MDTGAPSALLPNRALALQFLAWLDARPRRYDETMEAWRTSCPALTVWEDCRDARLVAIRRGPKGDMAGGVVALTDEGRAFLAAGR